MTPSLLRWLPLLVALLATPAFGLTDVAGWRDVRWGMPVEEALRQFDNVHVVQRTKIELNGCYVSYAVRIELFDEAWHAWMCEDRSAPVVVAVHIESAADASARFDDILSAMVGAYGLPHRVWSNCMNAVGRPTVQVRWYFPRRTRTAASPRPLTYAAERWRPGARCRRRARGR